MIWNLWRGADSESCRTTTLYVTVYVAYAMAALTAYDNIPSGSPVGLALLLGAISLIVARFLSATRVNAFLVNGVALVATLMIVTLTPLGVVDNSSYEGPWITAFVWLSLALMFRATSVDSLLFLLTPFLAMLIAGAIVDSSPVVSGYALVFCLASIFALQCHASIRALGPGRRFRIEQMLLNSVTVACVTFIATALIAALALTPIRIAGAVLRPLLGGTGMRLRGHPPVASKLPGKTVFGSINSSSSVTVGQGPVHPTNTPVLTVRAQVKQYLQSRTYDSYTTTGWRDSGAARPHPFRVIPNGFALEPDVYTEHRPVAHQQIHLIASTDLAPTYERWVAIRFQAPAPPHNLDPNNAVYIEHFPRSGVSYSALSFLPPSLDGLKDGPIRGPIPTAPSIPLTPLRLQMLARKLRGPTDVDTTRRVIAFVQSRCTYDLNAPAVPAGHDAVDYFLFDSRAGYCDLFATSAAVLLQLNGIPARYSIGYLPGRFEPDLQASVVSEAEAHAWVDVFIRGQGWIPVDPTPPGFSGPPSPAVTWRWLMEKLRLGAITLSFQSVLLFAAALLSLALLYRALPSVRRQRAARALGLADQPIVADYWALLSAFRRVGLDRAPHETPAELLEQSRSLELPGEFHQIAGEITAAFIAARYGRKPVSHDSTWRPRLKEALRGTSKKRRAEQTKQSTRSIG